MNARSVLPFDGDVVVVEDPAEMVETEVARERCRLGADAFHQAAVAADRVDVVVEQLEARLVVAVGEPPFADRHADAGRDALAERAGGRLDAGHHAVFGMPGRLAAELTEVADVIERDRRLAQPLVVGIHGPRPGQVEHRPEQHRGVAVREHEAVAARPDRVLRVEAHDAIPERVDQRRERHRRSRVPGVGRLDRIHRQRPNGVDGELIHLRVCGPELAWSFPQPAGLSPADPHRRRSRGPDAPLRSGGARLRRAAVVNRGLRPAGPHRAPGALNAHRPMLVDKLWTVFS